MLTGCCLGRVGPGPGEGGGGRGGWVLVGFVVCGEG